VVLLGRTLNGSGCKQVNDNLFAIFAASFPADCNRPCVILPDGGTISDGERLATKGVACGDHVLVQAPKSIEAGMLYLAVP